MSDTQGEFYAALSAALGVDQQGLNQLSLNEMIEAIYAIPRADLRRLAFMTQRLPMITGEELRRFKSRAMIVRVAAFPLSRSAKPNRAQLQTLAIVLVWLLAVIVPIVQQRLGAEGQLVTDAEVGTLSFALAITVLLKQHK